METRVCRHCGGWYEAEHDDVVDVALVEDLGGPDAATVSIDGAVVHRCAEGVEQPV